jgi:hypothetical protein
MIKKYIFSIIILIIFIIVLMAYPQYYQKIESFFYDKNEIVKDNNINEQKYNEVLVDNIKPISTNISIDKSDKKETVIFHQNIELSNNESKSIEYLKYLNIIIFKFLQDISFTEELDYLQKINLNNAKEMNLIIQDFAEYNKLLNIQQNNTRIFPKNFLLLEKFIKIDKITDIIKKQQLLKQKIIFQINNIFYVKNFLGVNHD